MENLDELQYFLSLFNYPKGKKDKIIKYIIETLQKAEESKTTLEFTKLDKVSNVPNPCCDNSGELFFNTHTFMLMFNQYISNVAFVKTEVAAITRNSFLAMADVAKKPLDKI